MRTSRFVDALTRCLGPRIDGATGRPTTDVVAGVLFEALSPAACMTAARKALRRVERHRTDLAAPVVAAFLAARPDLSALQRDDARRALLRDVF